MTKPKIIVDPHWRTMDELFSPADRARLGEIYDVIWGEDAPIPQDVLEASLPDAQVIIAATPTIDHALLDRAANLKAVIEVSGAFPETIDYRSCFARGIEVLSCAPGFREAVAEMALAMALSAGRGLISQHEAFRRGDEAWLSDRADRDFTLFDASVGFVGFGSIGQEIAKVMAPFRPRLMAYDPWLPPEIAAQPGAELASLDRVMAENRCVFVVAAPSRDNAAMVDAAALAKMQDNAVLILVSRAHLVDFPALLSEIQSGRISAAVDVFPDEPVSEADPLRQMPGLILSPHRAAAVQGGRQLIGRMILADLDAIFDNDPTRMLSVARPETVGQLAGVGDASKVGAMAVKRE